MTDDQIKHMVTRFLGWTIPSDFKPDGGISYERLSYHDKTPPTGTNLFDADQATAMVRYLIEGPPVFVTEETLSLKRRVAVLERIIAEDLNPNDCMDEMNAMIVEGIHKRDDGLSR